MVEVAIADFEVAVAGVEPETRTVVLVTFDIVNESAARTPDLGYVLTAVAR